MLFFQIIFFICIEQIVSVYFLPLLDLLALLLRDLVSSSGSSSDAGYATGDGENGGDGGIYGCDDSGGDSEGDLIPIDEADGTDGLDGVGD